jgi:CRP-like cAMP-binding protein
MNRWRPAETDELPPRAGPSRRPVARKRSRPGSIGSDTFEGVTFQAPPLREPARGTLATGFISRLPSPQAERLIADSIAMDVPAGAVVYREGDAARCFVVVSGLLRSFVSSMDGRRVNFRYGRSGDVLGLASVLGDPLPVTIQALTPSSVVAIGVDLLRQMVVTDPEVARACAEELTRELVKALEDVALSAFYSVRQRLARQLLDLAADSDGAHLVAAVSHQELADSIASSREVVTRTLHELRADGLIETGHDHLIVLLNVAGLAGELTVASGAR